jgi:carbonic anhydrase
MFGILCLLTACQASSEQQARHQEAPEAKQAATQVGEEIHWGYEGKIGPEHWADLSPEFCECRDGQRQSPIDLSQATVVTGKVLERELGRTVLGLDQRASVMDLVDNGHTIQITNDVPMALDVDGEHFELVQYHFHAPSEHTIGGEHASLEVHLVHKSAAGHLAVVGVLIEEGAHDPVFDPIVAALPSGPGDRRHLEGLDLDPNEFQPLPKRYYRYEDSLTTPPCTEGVQWLVMAERRQISSEQMRAFDSHLHRNNRPIQPSNERELLLISE